MINIMQPNKNSNNNIRLALTVTGPQAFARLQVSSVNLWC